MKLFKKLNFRNGRAANKAPHPLPPYVPAGDTNCRVCYGLYLECDGTKSLLDVKVSAEGGCFTCLLIWRATQAFGDCWAGCKDEELALTISSQNLKRFESSFSRVFVAGMPYEPPFRPKVEIFVGSGDGSPYPLIPSKCLIPEDSSSEVC
jgi:hypothetical protein